MKKEKKPMTLGDFIEKNYKDYKLRQKVRQYVPALKFDMYGLDEIPVHDYYQTVTNYFKEHGIDAEPLLELDYDFDDDRTIPFLAVYYYREENDTEYNKRIESTEDRIIRNYDAYTLNFDLEIERQVKMEKDEYELYLKLKKKYDK